MCTAATYQTKDFYFGRTLDHDCSYGEEVAITPRNYEFLFHYVKQMPTHYAMIGMAHVLGGYPLYYEAVNEKGLGIAGLNFPENADYKEAEEGKDNVAPFELIPWILGQCASLAEARELIKNLNIVKLSVSEALPATPLHWMIADKTGAITMESTKSGLHVYENPVGVLANNPTFDIHLFHLNNYMNLSPKEPENRFAPALSLQKYCLGLGAVGLPGDLSSMSRFVRVAFVKMNSVSGDSEAESVGQFFHILGSVEQQKGCCNLGDGKYEFTLYTSCCNASKGIYYYTTYGNRRITAIDMHREDLDGSKVVTYGLEMEESIKWGN